MLSLDDVPFPGPGRWIDGLIDGQRGELVQRKSDRSVWRVEEEGRVWFAKQGRGPKVREVVREADWVERLDRAGVPVSQLLAAGRVDGTFWLITAEAAGRPLGEVLSDALSAGDRGRVRRALGAAADLAALLHDAGLRMPDLTASHVFVDEATEGAPSAMLIDVARAAAPLAGIANGHRAEDLAALLFSLPFGVGRIDRVRVLRRATGWAGDRLSELARRVDREIRKLVGRTRWRHGHAGADRELVSVLAELRGAAPEHLFDALLDPGEMTVLRTLPDRQNRRIDAPDGRNWFMKIYPPVDGGLSQALRERRGIDLLQRAGVPVCREAAYGEDVERGSFVVVAGCPGQPLDDLLRSGVSGAERRVLGRMTAQIWRRMRQARLRHRDAYPCHVFVDRLDPGADGAPRFAMSLIDLTRAGRAPHPRRRWFVKDAAQLWHGLPRDAITRTDAVRWLREYFSVPRLDAAAKRFARAVAAKERRIRARSDRKAARA